MAHWITYHVGEVDGHPLVLVDMPKQIRDEICAGHGAGIVVELDGIGTIEFRIDNVANSMLAYFQSQENGKQ